MTSLQNFKADELDFVRRFIMLTDLAYEAKTRIVCLSSVPLFKVFSNIVLSRIPVEGGLTKDPRRRLAVKGEGRNRSSMISTLIGGDGMECDRACQGATGEWRCWGDRCALCDV
jgi:protein AFG1